MRCPENGFGLDRYLCFFVDRNCSRYRTPIESRYPRMVAPTTTDLIKAVPQDLTRDYIRNKSYRTSTEIFS